MVSKNNKYQKQLMTLDREVPHYSLRKLGIGVVSVLLGTTMYFGANNTVANADEVASGSNANDNASQTGVQNTGKVVALNTSNTAAQSTAAASTAQSSQATVASANPSISAEEKGTTSANVAANVQSSQSTATSSATTAASQASQNFKPQSASQQNINWGMVYKTNPTAVLDSKVQVGHEVDSSAYTITSEPQITDTTREEYTNAYTFSFKINIPDGNKIKSGDYISIIWDNKYRKGTLGADPTSSAQSVGHYDSDSNRFYFNDLSGKRDINVIFNMVGHQYRHFYTPDKNFGTNLITMTNDFKIGSNTYSSNIKIPVSFVDTTPKSEADKIDSGSAFYLNNQSGLAFYYYIVNGKPALAVKDVTKNGIKFDQGYWWKFNPVSLKAGTTKFSVTYDPKLFMPITDQNFIDQFNQLSPSVKANVFDDSEKVAPNLYYNYSSDATISQPKYKELSVTHQDETLSNGEVTRTYTISSPNDIRVKQGQPGMYLLYAMNANETSQPTSKNNYPLFSDQSSNGDQQEYFVKFPDDSSLVRFLSVPNDSGNQYTTNLKTQLVNMG